MHDAAVMAGMPGSSVVVISHPPQAASAIQAASRDFPESNPLAGTAQQKSRRRASREPKYHAPLAA